MDLLTVVSAKHVSGHILRIKFSDGKENEVDFKPYLLRFNHPDYERYLEEKEFVNFDIIDGNLNWNDYHMIFTIESLYKGKL